MPRIQQSRTESNGRIYRGDTMELISATPAPATRITRAFEQARRGGRGVLIPYFMCGYPSATQSIELGLAEGLAGADVIELGIAFSEPLSAVASLHRSGQFAPEPCMNVYGCNAIARV